MSINDDETIIALYMISDKILNKFVLSHLDYQRYSYDVSYKIFLSISLIKDLKRILINKGKNYQSIICLLKSWDFQLKTR